MGTTQSSEQSDTKFLLDNIIRYEDGEMDHDEIVAFFQVLVDNGTAWSLQGHYARVATALLEAGEITA